MTAIVPITAYLTIIGVILSLIYVVGRSNRMAAAPGWRAFFVAQHTLLIGTAFAALWVNPDALHVLSLIWAVTLFALVLWHYKLQRLYG